MLRRFFELTNLKTIAPLSKDKLFQFAIKAQINYDRCAITTRRGVEFNSFIFYAMKI
jgi:hypothetical protein